MDGVKKLPIVSEGAKTTAFCAEEIKGPGGLSLWVDGNGKITASGGTLEEPKPNAFSLVQVEDCPGRTPSCEASCYVHGLEKHAKSTHDLYRENSKTIRDKIVKEGNSYLHGPWVWRMAEWISVHCDEFRWHVSGDVYGEWYARWISDICRRSPGVKHWIYTRSFMDSAILKPLLSVATVNGGNLALNLSADKDNYWWARRIADQHGLRVCYMTSDGTVPDSLRKGDVIFPDYSLRAPKTVGDLVGNPRNDTPLTPYGQRQESAWWQSLTGDQKQMVCPVDFYGKSEGNRCGPCRKCMT